MGALALGSCQPPKAGKLEPLKVHCKSETQAGMDFWQLLATAGETLDHIMNSPGLFQVSVGERLIKQAWFSVQFLRGYF